MSENLRVEFSGKSVSRCTKKKIQRKIRQFLESEFNKLRDEFEEQAMYKEKTYSVGASFGDDKCPCYIGAELILDGNVRFKINSERYDDYLVFWASRLSGKLTKVHICTDDTLAVHRALDLLILPSWTG